MATNPASLVHQGVAGTGAAVVLGRDGDPLKAYLQKQQNKSLAEAEDAKRRAKQKEEQEKQAIKDLDWNPDKYWERFNEPISQDVRSLREFTMDARNQGTVGTDDYARKRANMISNIEASVNNANYAKERFNSVVQLASSSNEYKKEELMKAALEVLDPKEIRNMTSEQIDTLLTQQLDNPKTWNEDNIWKSHIGTLEKETFNIAVDRIKKDGSTVINESQIQSEVSGALLDRDASGKPIPNPKTGGYMLKATDDATMVALNNDKVRHYLDQRISKDPEKYSSEDEFQNYKKAYEDELIARGLSPKVKKVSTKTVTGQPKESSSGLGWVSNENVEILENRDTTISLTNQKGGVSDSYVAAEYVVNVKTGGKPTTAETLFKNTGKIYDATTGKLVPASSGDLQVSMSRIVLLPFQTKPTKSNQKTGIRKGKKEDIDAMIAKNPDAYEYRWYAVGTGEKKGSYIDRKQYMIPFESNKADVKKYGIDLDKRKITEAIPVEITQKINLGGFEDDDFELVYNEIMSQEDLTMDQLDLVIKNIRQSLYGE
jgi:hypothetical protein